MKAVTILLAILLTSASAPLSADDDDQPPPSAPELLRQVIAQLPHDPLDIHGTLTVRRKRALLINRHKYRMHLDWGDKKQSASYSVMDMTGLRLGLMKFKRDQKGLHCEYFSGESTTPTNAPPLTARVQGTDVTWLDLSLDFLWWEGAEYFGTDTHLNRLCDVIVVPAPEGLPNCVAAKLWIDRKLRTLLRAEQINGLGNTSRKMWVRSVKKIDGYWMIKEMEIQSYPGEHRTRLSVNDMSIQKR